MIRDPARLTLAALACLAALGSPLFMMNAFGAWHSRVSKGFIRNIDTVDIRVERVASGESWVLPAQGELAAAEVHLTSLKRTWEDLDPRFNTLTVQQLRANSLQILGAVVA
ncbi:MAG: hypothetical protein MUC36_06440, partial [Planctomycetes bacterium]|nr:hypothetical protein [Planctomycetota bacterium]